VKEYVGSGASGRRAVAAAVVMAATVALAGAGPQAPSGAPADAPAIGDTIPAFDAQKVEGGLEHVAFPKGGTTVLLFFLSGCPTCHKMLPQWSRAYERRPKGLTVIGVLMDQEPPGFFETVPITFPVVRSPGREFLNGIKVRRAPVTLRVGPGGKVEDVSLGLVDPIRLGQLFH
jgi:hypothetical protein